MNETQIAVAMEKGAQQPVVEKRVQTLGTVRLRHHETNEIIRIPVPSNDPNDPLNWYASSCVCPMLTDPGLSISKVSIVQICHGCCHLPRYDDVQLPCCR